MEDIIATGTDQYADNRGRYFIFYINNWLFLNNKNIFAQLLCCKKYKAYASINKQVKIGGSEAHDGVGKNLPVEYSERYDDHFPAYF
jgi:hypothetical protein